MIPQFVLDELRHIADSTDSVKRVRGRRGLDMLQDIQNSAAVQSIAVYSRDYPDIAEVDAKLLRFASEHHAMIVTTDYNLNKVATVQKGSRFQHQRSCKRTQKQRCCRRRCCC